MDRARGSVSRNGQPELWFTVGFPDGDLTEERGADGAKSAATENQPARRAPASVRTEIKQIQSSGVSTPQAGSSVYAPVPALRQAGSAPVPALVQSVGSKSMEQSLHEIFVVADKNGNGSLSRAELILRLRKDSELAALLKLPASGMDGERGAFEQVFHRMMDNMDTDSSVSAKEFVRHLSSEVAVAEEPQPQRWQKQIEDELRTMLIEAKDAAATANSAALAIVKRQVAPPRPGIPSPLVGITLAPKDSKIEEVNKLLMVKLKKQETQVMRLARQLDDMRVDLERVQWDNSNPELAQELSRSSAKSKAAAALKPAEDAEPKQDPVSQAAFRQAASKNQISTMKMMFSEGGMDVDGRDDYGWADGGLADGLAISKCGLKGFTALHHAAFGDSGVSLDAMRQLLLWDCNMNVKDAAGITARGYAVDPRAAALLDLASGNYKPQSVDEGFDDPVLLPNLSGFEGVDRVRILIEDVWPARSKQAEQHAAILEAAATGDEVALTNAIDTSIDPEKPWTEGIVDCEDGFGQTALCWAAHQGHRSVVQRLLLFNADPLKGSLELNGRGNFLSPRGSPFLNACRGGHADCARLLNEASGGIDSKQLEAALKEIEAREADDSLSVHKFDVFCHWAPQHKTTATEKARMSKGLKAVRQFLKELYALQHNADVGDAEERKNKDRGDPTKRLAKARAKATQQRDRERSKSPGRGRSPGKTKKKKKRSTTPGRLPPVQVAAALAGPGGMQAMLLSPTAMDTLSPVRLKELAADYEKQSIDAAKQAADGAMAVAAVIKETGERPAPVWFGEDSRKQMAPEPPKGVPATAVPRFTKHHRELRLSNNGRQVEKKASTTHGQWRTALCAGSKMAMRRGGGGVAEDHYAEFTLRAATGSEIRAGEAEGRTGLEKHEHHKNHNHHRALPRNITIGVAHGGFDPDHGRASSGAHAWGYCAHSGLGRHSGKTFDWKGRTAAGPGDVVGLHLALPEDTKGGALSVYLNGVLLGVMCNLPAGEYVWMVEGGDPGESITISSSPSLLARLTPESQSLAD